VDDEPINLEFFEVMLSKLGFEVGKAVDGLDALEKVVEFKPDIIILDNIMPNLTGWEVTKKLKNDEEFEEYRSIPIIMFSAMDNVNDKIEGLELGVDDYITKPFVFREVLARIRAVLRHRELALQVQRRVKMMELLESLNKMLLSFYYQTIKDPLNTLVKEADKVNSSDKASTESFCKNVKQRGNEMFAKFEGLEKKIEELQKKVDDLKKDELSEEEMESIEAGFFKLIKEYQKKDEGSE
jgi:DNA-binding response OmpR family regulator